MWAIVLGALAPVVSRWLASQDVSRSAVWLEVCATRDGVAVSKATALRSKQPGSPTLMDHCPLCVVHTDHAGLPPVDFTLALVNGLSDQAPRLFLQSVRTPHVWAAARARAPPVTQA